MGGKMLDDLRGKAVLVTGASSGIGAAVAKGFGRYGARVAVQPPDLQGPSGRTASDRRGRLPQRKRRHQAGNALIDDAAVRTAEEAVPRMIVSGGKRHRELVSLIVTIAVAERSPHGIG
jgi:NAD(P)-dependent dehydrogenase (short-subunit alcohol dehydrogenase family)